MGHRGSGVRSCGRCHCRHTHHTGRGRLLRRNTAARSCDRVFASRYYLKRMRDRGGFVVDVGGYLIRWVCE